jgi:hypothetical protein
MKRATRVVTLFSGASDKVAPSCVITCTQTSPTAVTPLNFTVTFSEAVTGFAAGDVTMGGTGGAVANFATVDNIVFTFTSAPSATGAVTVDVAAGVCTDLAGNANTAATQFSITAIVYTLSVAFATDDDAPISNPYNGEIGALVTTDTGNKADSDATVIEIQAHNARHNAICGAVKPK